jgi:5-methyltetrahydropteroyltriglutamate--homocysteine methyltransferase
MTHSSDRILTTHVGSLVRPPELRPFLIAQQEGKPYDEEAYRRYLQSSVGDVVRRQAEVGVDIVSDGEYGKDLLWCSYVNERLDGLEHDPKESFSGTLQTNDARMFPEFWAEYGGTQALDVAGSTGWVCNGPVSYSDPGRATMQRDIDNFKAALERVDGVEGFLPLVAPASLFGIKWDSFYESEEEFLYAASEALREEYQMVLDAGLLLQVDDAFLPWWYDVTVPPSTFEEYYRWADLRVDILNHALRGLPEDRIRYHICWGSFNAPHVADVPLKDIVDLVLKVNAGQYAIEMANPRHEHEWRLWEDVKLPEGKVLIPGVISHATNVVEHPELVAERLVRLAKLVGRENVIGGTDCGFAQGPLVQRVHPSIMWAKLGALAEGAELATKELWPAPIGAAA